MGHESTLKQGLQGEHAGQQCGAKLLRPPKPGRVVEDRPGRGLGFPQSPVTYLPASPPGASGRVCGTAYPIPAPLPAAADASGLSP